MLRMRWRRRRQGCERKWTADSGEQLAGSRARRFQLMVIRSVGCQGLSTPRPARRGQRVRKTGHSGRDDRERMGEEQKRPPRKIIAGRKVRASEGGRYKSKDKDQVPGVPGMK